MNLICVEDLPHSRFCVVLSPAVLFVTSPVPTQTIHASLDLDASQQAVIDATREAFAEACRHAMSAGRQLETTSNALIHRACYHTLRSSFGLSANLAVRAIARAAQCLKDPAAVETTAMSIDYDRRTLSINAEATAVSLSTVRGRLKHVGLRVEADGRRRLRASRVVRAVLRHTPEAQYTLEISIAPGRLSD